MPPHKNQAESELSLALHFCRLQASDRLHKAPPTPGRGNLLHSVHQRKSESHPETPSQMHPE